MRSIMAAALVAALTFAMVNHTKAADKTENIQTAIDFIVLSCVAGGKKVEITGGGKVEGGLALKRIGVAGEEDVRISKSEAQGLVDGLRDSMSKITADQASEARKCMQPYIDRILNIILGNIGPSAQTSKTIESDGVQFSLQGCKRGGATITCNLTATSLSRNRTITVGQQGWRGKVNASPLRDNNNNVYIPSSVKVANQLNGRYVGVENFLLVANIDAPITLVYSNVANDAQFISLLEIGVRISLDGKSSQKTVPFDNIPLN